MTAWMKKLIATFDALRGRWVPFVATTEADLDAVMSVLEVVRRDELRRVTGDSVKDTAAFAGAAVDDRLIGVRDADTGRVVACMRVLMAGDLKGNAAAEHEYRIVDMPDTVIEKTAVFTRFAVLPEYRRTAAGLIAMRHAGGVSKAEWGAAMLVFTCEPGLYPLYVRLGLRPLGRIHLSPSGAYRIPMVGLFDEAHVARMSGPLKAGAAGFGAGVSEPLAAWYRDLQVADGGDIDVGVELVGPDSAPDAAITRGLSATGREALLRSTVRLRLSSGEPLVRKGDGGRNLYVVEAGVLGALDGERFLGSMSEGEVFGEMSLLLDTPRTADVVALTDDAQVMVLSQRAIGRLDSAQDQAVLWRSVAEILARRLYVRQVEVDAWARPHAGAGE